MPKLTSYHLKLIAAVTMLLDHIGEVLYPEVDWLRMIGRFSFPIFLWLLVQGEARSQNIWRYGLRLGILGLISQPIYQFAFEVNSLNVLFHLLIGLFCLRAIRKNQKWGWLVWIAGAIITELFDISYGSYGIALLLLIRYFRPTALWGMAWIGFNLSSILLFGTFQLPAIATPLLFICFSGAQGPKARWFYGFYPVHIALLGLIRAWL